MKAYFPPVRSLALLFTGVALHASCSIIVDKTLQDKPPSSTSSGNGAAGSGNGGSGGAGGNAGAGGNTCDGTCIAEETCCMGACFSLQTDKDHCGNCDVACATTEVCCAGSCNECCNDLDCPTSDHKCLGGTCKLKCTAPAKECTDVCADVNTDSKNCGVCGNDCLSGHACTNGVCESGWATMSTYDGFSPRQRAAAAWTGSQLFIWGGQNTGGVLGDGALYDPKTDTWTMLPSTNAPSARVDAVAVRMNDQILVWGGGLDTNTIGLNTGKIFDLATSQWLDIGMAPIGRRHPISAWTGSKVLLWGGMSGGSPIAGGALYDPQTNQWSVMTNASAPSARSGVGSAWSGTELLFFGGRPGGSGSTNEGYAYHPGKNAWRKLDAMNAPTSRFDTFAAWTGTQMLIVGGRDGGTAYTDAALYDPMADTWSATMPNPAGKRSAPTQRTGWAASGMPKILVAGGLDETQSLKVDGRVYDLGVNDWGAQIPPWPSGVDHEYGAAVWTGEELILWSGFDNGALVSVGDRYRP